MKLLLTLSFIIYLLPLYAQHHEKVTSSATVTYLTGKKGKNTKKYESGDLLTIHYTNGGPTLKSQGNLLMYSSKDSIKLMAKSKAITAISINSIISIGKWRWAGKRFLLIIAAPGVLFAGIAILLSRDSYDLSALGFAGLALIDFTYLAIAAPATFIEEILAVHSVKHGYHFSVEDRTHF